MANSTYSDFPERKAVSPAKAGSPKKGEYTPGKKGENGPYAGKNDKTSGPTIKDTQPGYKMAGPKRKDGGMNRAAKFADIKIAVLEDYEE